jgi:hypothetical protein
MLINFTKKIDTLRCRYNLPLVAVALDIDGIPERYEWVHTRTGEARMNATVPNMP